MQQGFRQLRMLGSKQTGEFIIWDDLGSNTSDGRNKFQTKEEGGWDWDYTDNKASFKLELIYA